MPAGAVEDDSLTGFGILSHLGVGLTHVLECWAARAGEKVSADLFAVVVFADFVEFVFENNDALFNFLRRYVGC